MPGGVGALRISRPPFLLLCSLFRTKSAFANRLFSIRCALFQVPYPVSPLLATHTKTAGCIPTIPIPELTPPPPHSLSHYLLPPYLFASAPLPLPTTHDSLSS